GADLIIESTGVMQSLADAIIMARFGGRILLFGIFTVTEGALPFYQLYFKELNLINARVAKSEDYTRSIELVESGIIRLEPLYSTRSTMALNSSVVSRSFFSNDFAFTCCSIAMRSSSLACLPSFSLHSSIDGCPLLLP